MSQNSLLSRMAGNIAAGIYSTATSLTPRGVAEKSVELARNILEVVGEDKLLNHDEWDLLRRIVQQHPDADERVRAHRLVNRLLRPGATRTE